MTLDVARCGAAATIYQCTVGSIGPATLGF